MLRIEPGHGNESIYRGAGEAGRRRLGERAGSCEKDIAVGVAVG